MEPKNGNDAARRKAVTDRLRQFTAELTKQLTSGAAEIWSRVEGRPKSSEIDLDSVPPQPVQQPVEQQQPVQQQQSKTEGEK